MAVSTSTSATIRGITYTRGSSFKCYSSQSGNGGSEGNASAASALTAGTTYYFHTKASGDNVKFPYAVSTSSGGAIRGWYKEAVFPYATYSVKYNANGGSGAPSAQTKTYGTNLTLSSTKPTRTGYTFQGWGTSASDTSVDYAAGATYSKNAAITLYAIWKANTYTISFNANGGTGAPSSVTKTYGKTLTLPTTVPTRANYKFLGWSATKTASSATYSAGGNYTANGTATLYAVWELEYLPPTISSLKAVRCESDGTSNDFGVYAKVTFNWECCQLLGANAVSAITVGGVSVSASGTSGSVSKVVGGSLSIETAHNIAVVVVDTLKSDGSGTTTKTVSISAAVFAIDFLSGGKGVAFGKPATEENLVDSNWGMNVSHDDIGFMQTHSTSGNIIGLGVGASGNNRGIWVQEAGASGGNWFLYYNGTNAYINAGTLYLNRNPIYGAKQLYNNTSGSNGTITLSETAANFTYLEIFITDNNNGGHGSFRVYSPNGKKVNASLHESNASNSDFLRRTVYTISGTSLTPSCGGYISFKTGTWSSSYGTNYIKVVRVVGYK